MFDNRALRNYLIGAVIIWAGLFAATTVLIADTGQLFNQMIIMAGGAFWFIVLVPAWLRTMGDANAGE